MHGLVILKSVILVTSNPPCSCRQKFNHPFSYRHNYIRILQIFEIYFTRQYNVIFYVQRDDNYICELLK